ncbi:MAG: hypothetical protein QN197_13285 [Armatimonadota bacterium]|nr:hypothetical protein [Armatimonadota bacterium]MDR7574347.1 hypothetical protein [Armatimonadota bacterium]
MARQSRKAVVYLDPAWAPDPTGRFPGIERTCTQLARHLREAHGLDVRGDEGLPLLEYWHRLEHAPS